jgi:hypothetical protein
MSSRSLKTNKSFKICLACEEFSATEDCQEGRKEGEDGGDDTST